MSEIGNKDLLRAWGDFLNVLGGQHFPTNLLTHGVQPVLDIGRALQGQTPPLPLPLDALVMNGTVTLTGNTSPSYKVYLTSPDAENAPCLDIQTNIDVAYQWNAIDLKVDGWEVLVDPDVEAGSSFALSVYLEDHLANFVCEVYLSRRAWGSGDGSLQFNMTGSDNQSIGSFQPSSWDGFVPAGMSLVAEFSILGEGETLGPATSMTAYAYGRAQLNNGNNGTTRVPRPLGIS